MHWAELTAIAIALAVDAFAVAIAAGVRLKGASRRQTFRLAWHFGIFQAGMLIIGWLAGDSIKTYLESYTHWIAFALLLWVGVRMIMGAVQHPTRDEQAEHFDPTKGVSLIMLAIATSIDALAVGLSLSVLNHLIWFPALIIGLTAALFTLAGLQIGKIIGNASSLGKYAEIGGGVVLILIGVNVLL
ncbi:manganese efflux pump MntP [Halodesulfovibrio spirochaetisodalis]|uniref:Putative manganese efflux pump MntP n=1 Tax=Halodesulfovibrio spirochaetisodalis TaxID=1560234 RepID=A0A1B7XAZ6_9BACT|nr:manganese efflux pump MntP family protein [Halodesulfovibrio spirochaetisodalis]OBQ46507.1 membrane protein [Halodesulfovibrio spirochaetisodalis]